LHRYDDETPEKITRVVENDFVRDKAVDISGDLRSGDTVVQCTVDTK
jgi:hypothetical protein